MDHFYHSIGNEKTMHRLSIIFKDNCVDLTIYDSDETAWNILVSKDEIAAQATSHNIEFAEYYNNIRKYIECRPNNVILDFKNEKFTLNLVLKNQMKKLYFHVLLKKVDFHKSLFDFVEILYKTKCDYFMELQNIKHQNETLNNEYETVKKKMIEFLERRKEEQLNDYNNFLAILNEKKRTILHLNDLLMAFRQGRPTVNPPVPSKRKNNRKQTQLKVNRANTKKSYVSEPTSSESESLDESDNDSNYKTDEESLSERKMDVDVQRGNNNISPVAGTSKMKDDDPFDLDCNAPTQPFTFPKRICLERKIEIVAPHREIKSEEKTDSVEKTTRFPTANNKKVTKVDFNTQDLLDNI